MGTTFKVYFPRVNEPPDVISSSTEQTVPRGSGTILLVEDDEAVRKLTSELLTSHGYKVLPAQNGTAALEISERYPDKIALLLTDIVMPGMSGPDLVEKLKSQRPDMNVLYMSGYAGRLLSHYGMLRVETEFLSKPFTKRDLLARVSASIRNSARNGLT